MSQQNESLPDPPCSESLLLCCVCGHLLDEPRLLRCLHSCCSSCLPPSSAGAADEQQVTAQPACPVCQETSSDIRCNGFIESRVNRYKAIARSSLCGMCADGGEDSQQAEVWCTSCRMSICETCLPYHRRCHKAHSTTRIEDIKSWDEVFPTPEPLCQSHDKPFSFACFSCKTCCCVDCWPSCDKLQHDMKHVSDSAVASYVENAQSDVANLARTLRSKAEVLSRRKQLAANLELDRQNDLQKLKSSKLRLLKIIDDVCVTAEARLRDTYDGLRATAEAISSSAETMDHKVNHAAKYSCYVVDASLSSELLMQEQSLLSRMNSLCADLDELRQPLEAGQYVAFDSTLPDDEAQLVDLVTSWIGMPRAMTDDLCVRKANQEMSFVITEVAAQHQLQQLDVVGSSEMVDVASDDSRLAERLSADKSTRRFEGASSAATISLQGTLADSSTVAATHATKAAVYTSVLDDDIDVGYSQLESSSNSAKLAAQQHVHQLLNDDYPRAPVPTVVGTRRVEGASSASTTALHATTAGSSALSAAPDAPESGFLSFFRRSPSSKGVSSSERVTSMADAGATPKEENPVDEFKKFLKKKGLKAEQIIEELRLRLSKWYNITLHVGLIGVNGTGKSTFINSLRRVHPTDPLFAKTGVRTTTYKPSPYDHPQYPNVTFWDLPGVGTTDFPRWDYLKKIKFDEYDFFLILSFDRVTEHDLWLAKEIQRADKQFYYLRTKIDVDVLDDKADDPEERNEETLLKAIKDHIIEEFEENRLKSPPVFLVCKNPYLYDFPQFEERLLLDLPKLKKNLLMVAARSHPEIKKMGKELTCE